MQEKIFLFTVEDRVAGMRLDQLIPQLLPDLSRSKAQKIIGGGGVTINERAVSKGYLARPRDLVRIVVPPPEKISSLPEKIPIPILHLDDEFAAVDKPAGLVVHPAPGHPSGTLVNALLYQLDGLSKLGGHERPGIVHRLDKDTSGVVLVARNDRAHRRLAAQFSRREVKKTYLALAWGTFSDDQGEWNLAIGRDRKERKKISSRSGRPRQARTAYRVIRRLENATLLEVYPETGRTHQIRVHLAEAHHPVLGDPIYGPKKRTGSSYHETAKRYGFAERLALHAWKVGFRHPTSGKELELTAPVPSEFEGILPQ